MYTDTIIPLSDIDIFWTKLDTKYPTLLEDEEIDVAGQMGLVTQEINSKPESVKKSLVKKILSQVFPFKSEKKTPLVQKDTRGRPTLKTQQQRGSESRQSAVVDSQESSFQLPRHSSFTPAMSNQQRPSFQRSRSTSSRGKKGVETSQVDSVVASPVKPEGMNNLRRFGRYIPSMLHCYVSNIQDVMPDGNCGFRSLAVGLGFDENQWGFVRQQLLQEVDTNREAYRYVFNSVDENLYEAVRHSINWFDIRPAPEEHWMLMSYTGLVVAQRFGVIVHLISAKGCITFFPLWLAPSTIPQHNVVCLLHMPQHFVNIRLEGDYPIPTLSAVWKRYRNDAAGAWELIYQERIQRYRSIIEANKEVYYHHEIL